MEKIKCIIADDELLQQEILESYINKVEKLQLIGNCGNGVEVFNILKKQSIDLLFLDIQMPLLTGLELLKSLRIAPKVIFTTAYREFALEGYELNILDYLLKPISFERFLKAIDKFENASPSILNSKVNLVRQEATTPFIYVKSDKKTLKILLSDIIYFEGMKDYVQIKTISGNIVTYKTLIEFENQLPQNLFVRIHRSYIVSLSMITAYTNSYIEINMQKIPIGQFYRQAIMKTLNN